MQTEHVDALIGVGRLHVQCSATWFFVYRDTTGALPLPSHAEQSWDRRPPSQEGQCEQSKPARGALVPGAWGKQRWPCGPERARHLSPVSCLDESEKSLRKLMSNDKL